MTFRTNDFGKISPEQPGYVNFQNKGFAIPIITQDTLMTPHLHELLQETYHTTESTVRETRTFSELSITIRDEERTLKTKHLIYDNYTVNTDDPIIKEIIAKALQEFNAEPTAIRIRINLLVL